MKLPYSLRLKLIDSVLAKPVPESGVVRMGAGANEVDAKILKFLKEGEPWLIAEAREGDQLICSTWNGETHIGRTKYPIAQFADDQFQIKHYFGTTTIFFDGLFDYARGFYIKFVYAGIHLRRILGLAGSILYNRRRLVQHQRIELLTFMIELAAEGQRSFSSIGLMTQMHSIRWVSHPNGESARSRLKLYLDALVDTGELAREDHDYRLTGYAIKMVEERAEQERKHKQGIRLQWLIAILAFITATLTIVQTGVIKLPLLLDITK